MSTRQEALFGARTAARKVLEQIQNEVMSEAKNYGNYRYNFRDYFWEELEILRRLNGF